MKKPAALALLCCAFGAGVAQAQTSVGVSIGINQPGIYGRIDIGNYPAPVLVAPQPVVIVQGPMAMERAPIYLYVPAVQQREWGRYCARYNACAQPVYFVQEQWVRQRYEHEHPEWRGGRDREHRGEGRDRGYRQERRGDRGERGDHGGD